MINVQLQPNGPITQMLESQLVRRDGIVDNHNEYTTWVEYWLPGGVRPVHRSAHVTLKQGLDSSLIQGAFGG